MEPAVIRVAQYLDLVNDRLREVPADVLVEGEVSDYRLSQGKWVSFDLKDEQDGSVLKCFMTAWQLTFALADGMRVRVTGAAKVSPRFGKFQMDVRSIEPVGEGALKKAYEELKKKLTAEGLFETSRKRPLPRFPERIGLITSRDAAAYGDFLRILNNRWGGVEVEFAHVHVQGQLAVGEILAAFAHFNALAVEDRPDVLVLVRGGGGLEDLHAFNDESVARAMFSSHVPVVCGVGHERDESLCDYVADVRASTPSNAAERVVPNRREAGYELDALARRVEERMLDRLQAKQGLVAHAVGAASNLLSHQRERLARAAESLSLSSGRWLPRLRERFESRERELRQLDPKRVLGRGYSLVTVGGKLVRSASGLEAGAEVAVQLAQGSFDAEVLRVDGKGKQRLV
jgi:exodeoxyribonuclease VII large subunit